jgi:hypothetical protein
MFAGTEFPKAKTEPNRNCSRSICILLFGDYCTEIVHVARSIPNRQARIVDIQIGYMAGLKRSSHEFGA